MKVRQKMNRDEITPSSLAISVKERLLGAGFRKASDLHGLRCTTDEAISIKREIDAAFGWSSSRAPQLAATSGVNLGKFVNGMTALEALQQEQDFNVRKAIPTFCKQLDDILCGGVRLGAVTEFCGAPGIGKTQLCMQLALDAQIPPELGGPGGGAVYIDTEGSMVPARLEQMAVYLSKHLGGIAAKRRDPVLIETVARTCSPGALMGNILVYRAKELGEQLSVLARLPAFLSTRPGTRVVIVDSMAFHFRYGGTGGGTPGAAPHPSSSSSSLSSAYTDPASRARLLQQVGATLHRVAAAHNVAVVVINQMTTKLDGPYTGYEGPAGAHRGDGGGEGDAPPLAAASSSSSSSSSSRLVPALGETWAHIPTHRLTLAWDSEGVRTATLVKSPTLPPGGCRFRVTEEGVRSYKPPSSSSSSSSGARAGAAAAVPPVDSASAPQAAGAGAGGSSSSSSSSSNSDGVSSSAGGGKKRSAAEAGLA